MASPPFLVDARPGPLARSFAASYHLPRAFGCERQLRRVRIAVSCARGDRCYVFTTRRRNFDVAINSARCHWESALAEPMASLARPARSTALARVRARHSRIRNSLCSSGDAPERRATHQPACPQAMSLMRLCSCGPPARCAVSGMWRRVPADGPTLTCHYLAALEKVVRRSLALMHSQSTPSPAAPSTPRLPI
jgi:hypothetical protein